MFLELDKRVYFWEFWTILLLLVIFILWIFYGGQEYEYIGLKPMKLGVNAADYIDETGQYKVDKSNNEAPTLTVEPVDNTPELPPIFDSDSSKNSETSNSNKNPLPTPKLNFKPKSSSFSTASFSFSKYSNMSEDFMEDSIDYNNLNIEVEDSYDTCAVNIPFTDKKEKENVQFTENKEKGNIQYTENTLKTPRTLALGGQKPYGNGNISVFERKCKEAVEEIFGKPFYCVRPNFLKNPETGSNLELDLYNADLSLAVEASGKQHYVFPNGFHKSYDEFIKQVRRDQFKVDMCDRHGIYLITVPYNVPYDKIKDYITYYLPEEYKKV